MMALKHLFHDNNNNNSNNNVPPPLIIIMRGTLHDNGALLMLMQNEICRETIYIA